MLSTRMERAWRHRGARPGAQAAARGAAETPDSLWAAYAARCRDNLHVVLAMSPVGEPLRARCRNFAGLATSTVIDWFQPWPEQALRSVAAAQLQARLAGARARCAARSARMRSWEPVAECSARAPLCAAAPAMAQEAQPGLLTASACAEHELIPFALLQEEQLSEDAAERVAAQMVQVHQSARGAAARSQEQLRQPLYVTPKNYLDFVAAYRSELRGHHAALGTAAARLDGGLQRLVQAG